MDQKTYKKIEIVGVSEKSVSDAIQNAIDKATQTIRHLDWFEVEGTRGFINDGKAVYQVTIKIGFRLE